ncbi:CvpA family protein [Flavobacterium sp. 3HN19-14]|uniref:CvpA family protein n=1 Tax=Flavobacterium sp. 3HN19-14 TaxID=3448133 RepID=UPI003EDFF594
MVFLDFVLGAFLGYGCYKGMRNGLFVELASLVSFVIGIYIAVKFSYLMRDFIVKHISWSPKAVQVTAFVLTLVLVIVGIFLLAKAFTKIADFAFLGCMNRIAGAVLGIFRMVIFLGIFLGLLQKMNSGNGLISAETQKKSFFFNPILKTSEFTLPVLKNWFEELTKTV